MNTKHRAPPPVHAATRTLHVIARRRLRQRDLHLKSRELGVVLDVLDALLVRLMVEVALAAEVGDGDDEDEAEDAA